MQAFLSQPGINPFELRLETFRRIEAQTKRPLLCYTSQTENAPQGVRPAIDDGDITGFVDLINSVDGDKADIFIVSNGGRAEATERIVQLLRGRFKDLRFIVPKNAYSAATMMCFSGNKILMLPEGTLGPIDPQLDGVPARAILRGFETLEERLAKEGAQALTAYVPLLQKYDLHLLERCRNAQQLSKDLAREWLSKYAMRKSSKEDVENVIEFFVDWDLHKSHGRSINATMAQQIGVPVITLKGRNAHLARSLSHQYELFFDKSPFYKVFENSAGIAWGRQQATQVVNIPIPTPGPPPTPNPSETAHQSG